MCVGGDGLQKSPGTAPTRAGEQGVRPLIEPTGLGLSNGCLDDEFVLLVLSEQHVLLLSVCDYSLARAAML